MNKRDLEERLINIAVLVVEISESMQTSRTSVHMSSLLPRSGNYPALNYREAQSTEFPKDFMHKIKVILHALRETHVWLRIIAKINHHAKQVSNALALTESNELIPIFVKSAATAQKNLETKQ